MQVYETNIFLVTVLCDSQNILSFSLHYASLKENEYLKETPGNLLEK